VFNNRTSCDKKNKPLLWWKLEGRLVGTQKRREKKKAMAAAEVQGSSFWYGNLLTC